MAKTKLGNVKGPKGDQGVRGSKWYNTDKITGTSTSGTAFPQSGIADAMPGDMALNPTTLNLYICREGGAAASAKWTYLSCIKGPQGERGPKGEPTTVDASLSESSTNPIQNKIVASNFKDVRDFLSRVPKVEYKNISLIEWSFNEQLGSLQALAKTASGKTVMLQAFKEYFAYKDSQGRTHSIYWTK